MSAVAISSARWNVNSLLVYGLKIALDVIVAYSSYIIYHSYEFLSLLFPETRAQASTHPNTWKSKTLPTGATIYKHFLAKRTWLCAPTDPSALFTSCAIETITTLREVWSADYSDKQIPRGFARRLLSATWPTNCKVCQTRWKANCRQVVFPGENVAVIKSLQWHLFHHCVAPLVF